ncbi:hypothetical protein SCLCIDRAFT_20253 [Scleroderma citrinum Foug A]|uniref:Uncharacterized protein n=1 Tax=Scleroderma citrinum Foug A TaxID=1036808 RepID=A0A0C3ATQ6_9AGAM|nr:hypothetical protein SCLCIDRAFT_20253 [Scleroderma citrinum Foug A]
MLTFVALNLGLPHRRWCSLCVLDLKRSGHINASKTPQSVDLPATLLSPYEWLRESGTSVLRTFDSLRVDTVATFHVITVTVVSNSVAISINNSHALNCPSLLIHMLGHCESVRISRSRIVCSGVGVLSHGQRVRMAPEAVCHACAPSFGTSR